MKFLYLIWLLPLITPFAFAESYTIMILNGTSEPGCNPCFSDENKIVNIGDKIIWTNQDQGAHTITSGNSKKGPDGKFDSGLFLSGGSWELTLSKTGDYPYYCMIHPWMKGVIHVELNSDLKPNNNQTQPMTYFNNNEEEYLIRINDLTSENNILKQQVLDYENTILTLEQKNLHLTEIISNLDEKVDNLNLIINEQLKIIYDWVISR